MKFLIILISFLALTGCVKNTDIINLHASSGEYESKTIGELSGKQSISSTIEFTGFKHNDNWPPTAYVGFYKGENNDESVQFLILRNNQDDEYFVAGYRVIEKGEETIKTSLNKAFQQRVNNIVKSNYNILQQNQIHNIGVLVLDVKTRKVMAYVGNSPTDIENPF